MKSFCLFKYWERLKIKKKIFLIRKQLGKKKIQEKLFGTQKNTSVARNESQISTLPP